VRAQRPGFELMRADKLGAISAKQMPDAEKRAKARFLVDTRRGFASADAGSAARFESADPGDLGLPNPVEPRTLSTFSTAGLREGAMPPSTPRLGFGGSGDLDLQRASRPEVPTRTRNRPTGQGRAALWGEPRCSAWERAHPIMRGQS
jgi:hypothetical protein